MKGVLLDTNVVSAGAPSKGAADARLVRWVEARSDSIYLSAVTVAELQSGVTRLARASPGRRAEALSAWLETLLSAFDDRVVPVDIRIGRMAGEMMDAARARGHAPGLADTLIAATAARHRFAVATRNLRHFRVFDVPAIDPLDDARESGPA